MTSNFDFDQSFTALAGFPPFPWQRLLFDQYLSKGELPAGVDIPTGLGKTAIMAIWLLARAKQGLLELTRSDSPRSDSPGQIGNQSLPRRLVYVVDRRAVVDQATSFAEDIRDRLDSCQELDAVRYGLRLDNGKRLPISTLRGRHIDNREWMEDPSAAAIIVGTVDMIGSRLLFEGYGVTRKMRPFAAGLLGCDTLVMLDEAHLVPPFRKLLKDIETGLTSDIFGPQTETDRGIVPSFRMLPLSATGWEDSAVSEENFGLSEEDWKDKTVKERLQARKRLTITVLDDNPELVSELVERAWKLGTGPARVLVYCDRRQDAEKVKAEIDKRFKKAKRESVSELLVGGRRVFERERLSEWLRKYGFVGDAETPPERPTCLIATSAGEVGIDLDADHMVCDLVEWERMVQRLGRVNRRGKGNAHIEVVAAPTTNRPSVGKRAEEWEKQWEERLFRLCEPLKNLRFADKESVYGSGQMGLFSKESNAGSNENYRKASLRVTESERAHHACPGAIVELKERAKQDANLQTTLEDATTSAPLRPALTRALVDAWSMTSLEKHTGRPSDIQPWLRGWDENQQPQTTTVIWRKYLPVRIDGAEASQTDIADFFKAAPPHTSEKLETETSKVFDWLMKRAKKVLEGNEVKAEVVMKKEDVAVCVLSSPRNHRANLKLQELRNIPANEKKLQELAKDLLPGAILVVNARFGGLSENGMLDEKVSVSDVAHTIDSENEWLPARDDGPAIRFRVRSVAGEGSPESDVDWRERHRFIAEQSDEGEARSFLIVEKWCHDSETEDDRSVGHPQELAEHHAWTEDKARAIADAVGLPNKYANMLAIAARLHDEGKRNPRWQRAVNPSADGKIYAKTSERMNSRLLDGYRHEFGSLPYAQNDADFSTLPNHLQELALHLIAAHHGWARPVISPSGGNECPSVSEQRACEIALRFARLQKRWGPWGLAWWEAQLRSADQQASRENDERGAESVRCT